MSERECVGFVVVSVLTQYGQRILHCSLDGWADEDWRRARDEIKRQVELHIPVWEAEALNVYGRLHGILGDPSRN